VRHNSTNQFLLNIITTGPNMTLETIATKNQGLTGISNQYRSRTKLVLTLTYLQEEPEVFATIQRVSGGGGCRGCCFAAMVWQLKCQQWVIRYIQVLHHQQGGRVSRSIFNFSWYTIFKRWLYNYQPQTHSLIQFLGKWVAKFASGLFRHPFPDSTQQRSSTKLFSLYPCLVLPRSRFIAGF